MKFDGLEAVRTLRVELCRLAKGRERWGEHGSRGPRQAAAPAKYYKIITIIIRGGASTNSSTELELCDTDMTNTRTVLV